MRPPVRVAVTIDDGHVERWVQRLMTRISQDARFELALVVIHADRDGGPSLLARAWRARHEALFLAYRRLDRRVARRPDDALARVPPELEGAPTRIAGPTRPGEGGLLSPSDIAALRDADLDVLLVLGSTAPDAIPLDVARAGTWAYDHGAGRRGTSHFWEMHDGSPVTATTLLALTPAGPRAIYRSWSATDPASLHRGRARTLAKAAEFPLRRLADVHRHGASWITRLPADEPDSEADGAPSPSRALTNRAAARFLARLLGGWARRRSRRVLRLERWALAVRPARAGVPDVRGGGWRLIEPPRGRFFADPFVLSTEPPQLLFEDYSHSARRAHIATLPLPPARRAEPSAVLKADWHLSYPFVVHDGSDWLVVPEAAERRRVQLHRLVDGDWRPDAVLLDDVEAYDATLLFRDGTWWMWVCIRAPGGPVTDEVSLFYADDLRGPWREHPASPVVSDVRRARPAGPLLDVDGRLLRPAQDSSGRYGKAIVVHEVTTLSRDAYDERIIARLEAGDVLPAGRATHTFVRAAGYEVVDVMIGPRTLRR